MNRLGHRLLWAFCLLNASILFAAPNAPTDLVAVKSPQFPKTQIDVSWQDRSDNEAGFRIERCVGAGCSDFVFIEQVGANATTLQNFDLPGGMTFRYRVQAFDVVSASGYSNEAEASTDPLEPPEPPTALRVVSILLGRVDLEWQDNSATDEGFIIERCNGAQCTDFQAVGFSGASVSRHSDTTVSANTTYSYRVQAFNGDGLSAHSNIAVATTPDGPPAAPSSLTARAFRQGNGAWIDLMWEDRSSDETSFEIERCRGAGCTNFTPLSVVPAHTTWFTDSSLSRRTTYRFRVRAAAGGRKSEYSNIAAATTP